MQQSDFRSTMDASNSKNNVNIMPKFEAANQQHKDPVDANLRHHPPQPSHDSGIVNVNIGGGIGGKRPRPRREVAPKEVAPPASDNENLNDQVNEEDRVFFESLPPGYRFCPTDDELIDHYLFKKLKNVPLPRNQIREVNIYRFNPDDIAARYPSINKNSWYFFTPRDKKYFHGSRPNRAAGAGFWKACGADRIIHDKVDGSIKIGLKKALVYHRGRPPKGHKTNWLMHEFMLHKEHPHWKEIVSNTPENSWKLNEFVLCKIYKRNDNSMKAAEEAEVEVEEVLVKEDLDAKLNASVKVEEANEAVGHGELKNFVLQNEGLHYSYPLYNPSIQYPFQEYYSSSMPSTSSYHPNHQLPPTSYHQNQNHPNHQHHQLPPTSYHQNQNHLNHQHHQLPPTSYHQNQNQQYHYDPRALNVNLQAFMIPSLPSYDSSSNNFEQVSSDSLPGFDSSMMNFEQVVSSNLEEMDYFVMGDAPSFKNELASKLLNDDAPSFANELASKLLNDLPAPASKVA